MLKNACLLATFATICCISNCSTNRINTIKNSLTRIAQAKQDIITEKEEIISINNSVKEQIRKEACGHIVEAHQHEEYMKTLNATLNAITARDEFKHVIEHSTDFQVRCIVDKHISYNDIKYTEEAYPIEQKSLIQAIDEAVTNPSLTRYTNNEFIFNVYYLEATQTVGYKLLLEKLDLKAQDLRKELAALEAHCRN